MALWYWTNLTDEVEGNPPGDLPARQDHTISYHPVDKYAVIYGGAGQQGANPSTNYHFDVQTKTWTEYTSTVITGALNPVSFYDPVNGRLVFGLGNTGSLPWAWYYWDNTAKDFVLWSTTGGPATGSQNTCGCWNSSRGTWILWGGSNLVQQVWELNPSTATWTNLTSSLSGIPQTAGQAFLIHDPVRDILFLFGGTWSSVYQNKVWTIDLNSGACTEITSSISFTDNGYTEGFQAGYNCYLEWSPDNPRTFYKISGHSGSGGGWSRSIDVVEFDADTYEAEYIVCDGDEDIESPSHTRVGEYGPIARRRAHFGFYVPHEDRIYVACGRYYIATTIADTWYLDVPTSKASFEIAEDGGYELVIPWTVPANTALEVFLGPTGDETDLACYGGEGNGYYPVSEDGATVTVYSPKVLPGDYLLSWREAGSGTPELCGYVTVYDRNHKTSIHRARRSHQIWSDVGPRRLELEQ